MAKEAMNPSNQKELSKLQRLGMKGAAALAAVAFGLTGCGDKIEATPAGQDTVPPTPEQNTSAPVTPGETGNTEPSVSESARPEVTQTAEETKMSHEELVASLEIEAGLSPEEFGKKYFENLDKQRFGGATEELWEKTFKEIGNIGKYEILDITREQATKNIDTFAEAMFAPGWDEWEEPSVRQVREKLIDNGALVLYQWVYNHNNTEGKPDYNDWVEIDRVESLPVQDGFRHLIIHGSEYNNSDEVEADAISAKNVNGAKFDIEIVTKEVDGKEKIIKYL